MYEEVDDRYKEKLNRMIQAQTMQIQEDFPHGLLASLPFRPALQQRRASSMAPRASIDGVRKMSLDLSGLRASMADGAGHGAANPLHRNSPMASPMGMGGSHNYVMSPAFDGSSQSPSYPTVVPGATGPLPPYLAQVQPGAAGTAAWASQAISPAQARASWAGFHPAQMAAMNGGDLTMSAPPPRQFRDRMGSAPVIPVHAVPSASGARTASQHARNRSEPHGMATTSPHHLDMLPTEPMPTPDLCPTPSTPLSPTSGARHGSFLSFDGLDKDSDALGFSHGLSDEDFDNFNQYAISLNNPTSLAEDFKIDELVALDDFPVSA